ncbi:MAG: CarD family transcriptional regulator [Bdellovibrionia bacterium]
METYSPEKIQKTEFLPGTYVIYAMHGKCYLAGRETRTIGGVPIDFYKLELKKAPLSRSQKQEPAIWVPVAHAQERGLRAAMSQPEAEAALQILMSREYYFKLLDEPWSTLQPQLENTIRIEGGEGLAKVASFLYVLAKKQMVPSSDLLKFKENVFKLLLKEISDALCLNSKAIEEKIQKGLRSKLFTDS